MSEPDLGERTTSAYTEHSSNFGIHCTKEHALMTYLVLCLMLHLTQLLELATIVCLGSSANRAIRSGVL